MSPITVSRWRKCHPSRDGRGERVREGGFGELARSKSLGGAPLKLCLGGDFDFLARPTAGSRPTLGRCPRFAPVLWALTRAHAKHISLPPCSSSVLCGKHSSLSPKKLESVLVPTILQNAGKAKSEQRPAKSVLQFLSTPHSLDFPPNPLHRQGKYFRQICPLTPSNLIQ